MVKYGKWNYSLKELEEQYSKATKRGNEISKKGTKAKRAYFDRIRNEIVLELDSGAKFSFPPNHLSELADATSSQIAEVSLAGGGSSLRWRSLDADYSVQGLLAGVFGTKSWMAELGRKGGQVRSPKKAKAARENGLLGGRPRKATAHT
jgi:hypothetical protein